MLFRSESMEMEITDLLIRNDVNFKRSNSDIEMIFINAKSKAEIGGKKDD